jgi:hypothetical protein
MIQKTQLLFCLDVWGGMEKGMGEFFFVHCITALDDAMLFYSVC